MSAVEEVTKPDVPVPAESEPASLFRYSTWLHAGAGAGSCPEVDENEGTNICGDHDHFHAWCRLPNPLQQAEIRERALAAKARKIRQLRDPASDAAAILDEELEARAREGEPARGSVIGELVAVDFFRDYYEAMMEVRQIEDPDSEDEDAKRFRHIEDDQARFRRLDALPEEQRPKDEYEELQKHLADYQEQLDRALRERTEPKRTALAALELSQLLEQLRDKRIENEAQREFQRVFEIHEWLSCALRERNGRPVFADLAALEAAPGSVIEGLQSTFLDLRRTAQEAQGN